MSLRHGNSPEVYGIGDFVSLALGGDNTCWSGRDFSWVTVAEGDVWLVALLFVFAFSSLATLTVPPRLCW